MKYRYFLFILIGLSFIACQKEAPHTSFPCKRVIIAYLAADNNLSGECERKIEALCSGMQSLESIRTRLFIYYDQGSKASLLKVSNVLTTIQTTTIAEYTDPDSSNPLFMQSVLERVIHSCPAEHYGLICFSHGTAWLPANKPNRSFSFEQEATRTVINDSNGEMELTDFAAYLPMPKGEKWEFILFEECYMGSVEVAYELKDKTEVLIASPTEILSPGMEAIYPIALPYLLSNTEGRFERFAQSYFDHWNSQNGDYRSATISVIHTEALPQLANLARTAFLNHEFTDEDLSQLQHFDRRIQPLFFDLKEALLLADETLEPAANEIFGQIVTYTAATPQFIPGEAYGFDIHTCCGLSTYLMKEGNPQQYQHYNLTSWYRDVYSKQTD